MAAMLHRECMVGGYKTKDFPLFLMFSGKFVGVSPWRKAKTLWASVYVSTLVVIYGSARRPNYCCMAVCVCGVSLTVLKW